MHSVKQMILGESLKNLKSALEENLLDKAYDNAHQIMCMADGLPKTSDFKLLVQESCEIIITLANKFEETGNKRYAYLSASRVEGILHKTKVDAAQIELEAMKIMQRNENAPGLILGRR